MTLVVNLIGGPGTGKSTTAAGTFFELKQAGVNCEYVPEYAKDVVWGRTTATLDNQLYVFAKQHHRFWRLLGQVEVIVTDCPLFLTLFYARHLSPTFKSLVLEEFNSMLNLNVFLQRQKEFNPAGRLQTEAESREIDKVLLNMLLEHEIPYESIAADRIAPSIIAHMVKGRLSLLAP